MSKICEAGGVVFIFYNSSMVFPFEFQRRIFHVHDFFVNIHRIHMLDSVSLVLHQFFILDLCFPDRRVWQ
jgi:hypothetical protein